MEARKKRNIKSGYAFDNLFPQSKNDIKTIRRNADLSDTMAFIPKVVRDTLHQTKGIAHRLKAKNVYDTCRNIWQFVYDHINYKKDKEGYEQVRSPARTWHDRRDGVDCDCYSVFISSMLTNLEIPHSFRITKYRRNHFQHIYPIVPNGSGHITMDCVTDYFNYEVPFTDKKDYRMDLQYLDGLDGATLGLFGSKKKKKAAAAAAATADPNAPPPPPPKKKKGFFKKVLNVVNKVNPATLLLRNGVLAAMKLNIMNVAKRLRWSYLSPDKLAEKGIDPAKFQKLVNTRTKLENIFYGAGGNPNNLKKAILNGKGNKDKAVSGLGMLPMEQWNGYMNEYTPLDQLLGSEIYYSENVEGMEGFKGFGELGEPVTLATVGAAMGVIAGIVAALKQVGDIFKKKGPESADFDEAATTAPENNVNVPAATAAAATAASAAATTTPAPSFSSGSSPASSYDYSNDSSEENTATYNTPALRTAGNNAIAMDNEVNPVVFKSNDASSNPAGSDKQSFWEKHKKWLKPVAISAGGLTIIAIGYKLFVSAKSKPAPASSVGSLSGIHHRRGKKKKQHSKHRRKQAIALL